MNTMSIAGCLAILTISTVCGCGGPRFVADQKFQQIDPLPEGKALIYFYRPMENQWADLRYPIYRIRTDGKPILIVMLYNGGYYPYVTKPGYVRVYSKSAIRSYRDAIATQSVDFNIKPGEIRFIRTYNGGAAASLGLPKLLVEMKRNDGQQEIEECFLIPKMLVIPEPIPKDIPEDWK